MARQGEATHAALEAAAHPASPRSGPVVAHLAHTAWSVHMQAGTYKLS